jgi:hypothetical protein
MPESNRSTNYGVLAAFGLIALIGVALNTWNFAKVVFLSTVLITGYLMYVAVKSGKINSENKILASKHDDQDKVGEQVNSVLDDIESWLSTIGIDMDLDPYNIEINLLYVPSLESEQLDFYSFIVQDDYSRQDLHVVIESNTQRIVHYGTVRAMPSEIYYPQDYIPAIMTLVDNQNQNTSKNLKDTLQAVSEGQLQGQHDFGKMPVDKTVDRDDLVVEAKTSQ